MSAKCSTVQLNTPCCYLHVFASDKTTVTKNCILIH